MNYAVANRSEVSDSYVQSMAQTNAVGAFPGIDAASPVGYANAQRTDSTASVRASQEANAAYNAIASGFAGNTTGYGSDSVASAYGMVGSNLDLFA